MGKWYEGTGPEEDVVISSRIRIARNVQDYRFPQEMGIEESENLTQEVLNGVKNIPNNDNYKFIRIGNLSPVERMVYIEEHLISPGLVQNIDKGSFLLREDENISIMINEEDHIRIQVLLPGLNLEKGWQFCDEIDDYLENSIDYAFHEDFGYLTACPTNVGTGLRASAMVHIPSLTMTGHINSLVQGLNKIGLTVRGIYGEGTEAVGNLYQISNQTTLGEKEERIIEKLKSVIYQIIERERDIRNSLLSKKRIEIEDMIMRSLGILKYSRKISSKEAMKHLSNVRLGMEMGIIKDMDFKSISKLMIDVQPAGIQKNKEQNMSKAERDIERAILIRKSI
ncbi:MAG: protein arginine kinase [Tissierellia bacterium]|nr:protein arginine kinase [Tissierellia bacterium]